MICTCKVNDIMIAGHMLNMEALKMAVRGTLTRCRSCEDKWDCSIHVLPLLRLMLYAGPPSAHAHCLVPTVSVSFVSLRIVIRNH